MSLHTKFEDCPYLRLIVVNNQPFIYAFSTGVRVLVEGDVFQHLKTQGDLFCECGFKYCRQRKPVTNLFGRKYFLCLRSIKYSFLERIAVVESIETAVRLARPP